LLLTGHAPAQPKLSLSEALKMARERNGAIIAATFDVAAARERLAQAKSAFLPTVTPGYVYNSGRQQLDLGSGTRFVQSEGGSSAVRSNWRLLDSGERVDSLRSSRASLSAQEFGSTQTVRVTLFGVTEQYYEALRAQELMRVADAQVQRAKDILDQIIARIEAKDAAEIERYQAEADYENAKVQALGARNRVSSTGALLKAAIGLPAGASLPELQPEDASIASFEGDLQSLTIEGLAQRADLGARRSSLSALSFSRDRAKRQAGLTYGLDARFDQQVTPKLLEDRAFVLSLSYPLFDGGERRAAVRELDASLKADRAALQQAERDVEAEIESAYAETMQNAQRLNAARVAREAANRNYEAARASQKAGAYDLLQVSAAQLSLVTADSNYIEAAYDHRISEVRLALVTGRPIPGEK
jgi:outer membrane protein